MKTYRQGDWTFVLIDKNQFGNGKKIELRDNKFVFSEGETTGHLHTIVAPQKEDMNIAELSDGSFAVTLYADSIVTHPEHSVKTDLQIPMGDYLLFQRREKDWFSLVTRKVLD